MNGLRKNLEYIRSELEEIYNGTTEDRNADGEPVTMLDYISDCLDIEYTIDSQGNYIGCRIWVTLGGPNIWIDTRNGEIRGAWGMDQESLWLPSEICSDIDEVAEEYYQIIKGA